MILSAWELNWLWGALGRSNQRFPAHQNKRDSYAGPRNLRLKQYVAKPGATFMKNIRPTIRFVNILHSKN